MGTAMEMTELGGLRVAYDRAGPGPPVVLLHGYVGDGPVTWRRQFEGLCGEFTVVAWDAPGAGGSSDPPETFGMAGYADCLAGFIDRLGLDQPHLAGLSFGGALTLAFQHRHPGVARTLILASGYAGWGGSLPADVAGERMEQALRLADLGPEELVDALLPTMFARAPAADARERFRASLAAFHPAGLRAMTRAAAENLREALPGIAVPTLVISGDRDVRAPRPEIGRAHV